VAIGYERKMKRDLEDFREYRKKYRGILNTFHRTILTPGILEKYHNVS
jgi:mannitol-1-phosphate/altronate dehydrogenase